MGIYLSQMPPAEMARLKAEIAETLIVNFSYPRFFDYRTNTLRMRPVDRAKRQEVWTFLSSFDFNTFSRIDVVSPDFQRQVERLLIQFVQHNRAFFGQQGRKRMPDVRALITSSSTAVSEGLRGHLSGHAAVQPPFGNPRPVISWSKASITGKPDLNWEQIVNPTMLLQQQLQEVRGEARPGLSEGGISADGYPAAMKGATANGAGAAPPKRSPRLRATTQGSGVNDTAAPPLRAVPPGRPEPQEELRAACPPPGPLTPLETAAEPVAPSAHVAEAAHPISRAFEEKAPSALHPGSPGHISPPAIPPAEAQPRELARTEPLSQALANQAGSGTVLISDEDVVIFEQLRHQLTVWLRVEVVRVGVEVTGQSPAQLIEILSRQEGVDATRLQVISTLLDLTNQVLAHGHARLVEYKQAMMFYLMHTRNAR
ncbi:MAG: hypothetical protein NVS3B14_16850 [Ktedonobacteraceae bacterium]